MNDNADLNHIAVSHELLKDCLQRITAGDPQGALDLANFWIGHLVERDPVIELGVVEGLMRQSAQLGSSEASEFLSTTWSDLRPVLEKRLKRLQT